MDADPGVMLDLLDIGLFSAGDPDSALSELRVSHPVFWQEDPGFFAILTHSGITEALRAVDALSSASGTRARGPPRGLPAFDPPYGPAATHEGAQAARR